MSKSLSVSIFSKAAICCTYVCLPSRRQSVNICPINYLIFNSGLHAVFCLFKWFSVDWQYINVNIHLWEFALQRSALIDWRVSITDPIFTTLQFSPAIENSDTCALWPLLLSNSNSASVFVRLQLRIKRTQGGKTWNHYRQLPFVPTSIPTCPYA